MNYNPIIIKTSDNINRIVDTSRSQNSVENIIQSNSNVGVPLLFGTQMFAPTLIYQATKLSLSPLYSGASFAGSPLNRDTWFDNMDWIGVYAVTLNSLNAWNNFKVHQIFLNGETFTDYANYAPIEANRILVGFNSQAKLLTGKPGNVFGERNVVIEYVQPNRSKDNAVTDYASVISNTIANHSNMLLNMYNIKDFVGLNDYTQLMIVAIRDLDTEKFENRAPKVNVVATRLPLVYDPADQRVEREANKTGNAVYELLYNTDYGLGIDKDNINYYQFKDVGSDINTVVNVQNSKILDLVNGLAIEDFGILSKINGQWNYYNESDVTVDFTVDSASIIGNFEITYPDKNTAPTKIIADYVSYTSGTRQVSIGDDESNVIKISIKNKNNITDVTSYLQYLYAKLNNTITYKFTMDKTATKFTIGDIIAVTTDIPDLNNVPMRIIGLQLNDDFTFDITAESIITADGTSVIFDSAKPVLKAGRPYKINITEPTPPTPDEEIEQPIVPIGEPNPPTPGEIAPPDPAYRTFDGLNHPYNFNTSADNLEWYLGSTKDGTTINTDFDSNGIQTVGYQNSDFGSGTFVYKNIPSLIYRRLDKPLPTAILWAIDVATNSVEQNLNLVGHTWFGNSSGPINYRYRSDGFLQDTVNALLADQGRGWKTFTPNWVQYHFSYKALYRGTLHPNALENGAFEYVYTPELSGGRSNHNHIHTFDANTRSPTQGAFTYASPAMQRSGVYRIHFSAVYDSDAYGNNFSKVEYIGSTSFYGDGRGVLPQFVEKTKYLYNRVSNTAWNYTYTSPPSRSIT